MRPTTLAIESVCCVTARELTDAASDDVRDRRRHPTLVQRTVAQLPLAGQQLDELPREERVPRRAIVDQRHDVVLDGRAGPFRHPGRHVVDGQAGQVQADRFRLAGELADAADQLLWRLRIDRPDGGDEEDAEVVERTGDELDEPERRRIGPLQVVDDGHDRDRSTPERVDDGRVDGHSIGRHVADPAPTHRPHEEVDRILIDDALLGERARDLGDGPEGGRCGRFRTTSPCRREAERAARGDDLLGQSGLADAGFAADDDHPAPAGRQPADGGQRRGHLGIATDEDASRFVGDPRCRRSSSR